MVIIGCIEQIKYVNYETLKMHLLCGACVIGVPKWAQWKKVQRETTRKTPGQHYNWMEKGTPINVGAIYVMDRETWRTMIMNASRLDNNK